MIVQRACSPKPNPNDDVVMSIYLEKGDGFILVKSGFFNLAILDKYGISLVAGLPDDYPVDDHGRLIQYDSKQEPATIDPDRESDFIVRLACQPDEIPAGRPYALLYLLSIGNEVNLEATDEGKYRWVIATFSPQGIHIQKFIDNPKWPLNDSGQMILHD